MSWFLSETIYLIPIFGSALIVNLLAINQTFCSFAPQDVTPSLLLSTCRTHHLVSISPHPLSASRYQSSTILRLSSPLLSSQVHNFTYIFLSKIILKLILQCYRSFLAHTCFSFLSLGVYTPFTYFFPYVVILPSFSPNITPALSVYFLFYFTQPIISFSLYFAFLTPPLIDMCHQFPTIFASIY